MSSNFTEDQRNLLIDLIKERRIVYDVNDPNYKNISYKRRVWKDIARLCKAQETTCKIVWKSMRDQYQRYMRAPINKRKQFRFLSKLSFLEGFTKSTKKRLLFCNDDALEFSIESSSNSSNQHIYNKQEYEDYQNYSNTIFAKDEKQNILTCEYGENGEESENEEITSEPAQLFKTPKSKEEFINSNDYFTQNINSENNAELNKVNSSSNDLCNTISNLVEKYFQTDEDDNDLFLKMIGKKMKYLPIKVKNRLQQRFLKEVNVEIAKLNIVP